MGAPAQNVIRRDGVAAIVCKDDDGVRKVLVGKRLGSHGKGSWGLPGGHVDQGESNLDTAWREVQEETGLKVRGVREVALTQDDFVADNKYYNTYFVYCEKADTSPAEPEIKEPKKCEKWEWMSWEALRGLREGSEPDKVLFRPLHGLLGLEPDLDKLLEKNRSMTPRS